MEQSQKSLLPFSRTDILLSILIGIAALALYIRTLAPSLLWGDSAEFQTLSYTLGMSHPSGYMTQIMIGKVFTYIPVGNIAYRINLMSAFFGALAVGQVYLIIRLLGGVKIAAISACLMLMLAPQFWWRALIAESYAPAAAMIATIWLCFLLWRRTGNWLFLLLAGLAGGLSVGIHSTVVMTAVPVLLSMLITARTRIDWFGAAAGVLLGLALTFSFFFYLDHHDPPSSIYNTVYRVNLSGLRLTESEFDTPIERFFAIFPASHFWSYYFSATPQEISRRLIEYLSFYSIWSMALILLGAIASFRRSWLDALYPLIAFLVIWLFAVTVSFSVYQEFYTPVALFVYVWFGIGASTFLAWIEKRSKQNQLVLRWIEGFLSILLIILPLWQARVDLRLGVLRGYTSFVREAHLYPIFAKDKAILDAEKNLTHVEDNAIVFADWDKLYSYIYTAHIVDGRTSITFHEAWPEDNGELTETAIENIDQNIDSRPIYFTVDMTGLQERYRVVQINNTLRRIYRK